jgi:tetratricopeptide (TPR) repeat protein
MRTSILAFVILLLFNHFSFSQIMPLTAEPDGDNRKASVSENIGIVKIVINYSRPGVRGREGKIWNTPVAHYGFADQGHGTSYSTPWRAGANENTIISFSKPVKIEGKDLAAGTYGFFIALGETESTLIFSNKNNSWGSFYYDSTQDALRVRVKNETLDKSVEWLRYDFNDETANSAVIAMSWEKRRIPFKVEADVQKLQIASFRDELQTTRSFYDFIQAANYCLRNNIELEQALAWMDRAIYFRVMGVKNFQTLSTKAEILMKLNRFDEAKKVMEEAVPLGSMLEVHFYARQLMNLKQKEEAIKVFKANYDKFPNQYTTTVGLGRAYSAAGDYKKAVKYMKAALPQAPDNLNKTNVENMIQKLEEGKDIN